MNVSMVSKSEATVLLSQIHNYYPQEVQTSVLPLVATVIASVAVSISVAMFVGRFCCAFVKRQNTQWPRVLWLRSKGQKKGNDNEATELEDDSVVSDEHVNIDMANMTDNIVSPVAVAASSVDEPQDSQDIQSVPKPSFVRKLFN